MITMSWRMMVDFMLLALRLQTRLWGDEAAGPARAPPLVPMLRHLECSLTNTSLVNGWALHAWIYTGYKNLGTIHYQQLRNVHLVARHSRRYRRSQHSSRQGVTIRRVKLCCASPGWSSPRRASSTEIRKSKRTFLCIRKPQPHAGSQHMDRRSRVDVGQDRPDFDTPA